jgi:multimeric flavodoxin WrbA
MGLGRIESKPTAITPMQPMPKKQSNARIAIINGSLGGAKGNTNNLIQYAKKVINKQYPGAQVQIVNLFPEFNWVEVSKAIANADGLIFATGTYWDSWGSPMQQLLEKMTQIEGKKQLVGKPAAVLVTMHSVGGKEVADRLQGVLSSMGCLLPPFTALAYSYADHVAHRSDGKPGDELLQDIWDIEDLNYVVHNLFEAIAGTKNWKVWDYLDTKQLDPSHIWLK